LLRWNTERQASLDEMVAAHTAISGRRPGRKYATPEINYAYLVLLCGHFERFCRDLHTEVAEHFVAQIEPATLRPLVRARLLDGRELDRANVTKQVLQKDFSRFGFDLWKDASPKTEERLSLLDNLRRWRNAIAHRKEELISAPLVSTGRLGGQPELIPSPPLHLKHVARWRSTCRGLARDLDVAATVGLASVVGSRPW